MSIQLKPAYGRTYKSASEVRKDWKAGKDFRLYGTNTYCSARDFDEIDYMMEGVAVVLPTDKPDTVRLVYLRGPKG